MSDTVAENPALINLIPDEILEYILSLLLPYDDLKSSMEVCSRWHRIVHDVIQHEQSRFQRAISECTLQWSALSTEFDIEPKITERYSHSAAYHSGSMYIFGGCTATGTTFNDLWRFDLGTRHWIRPLATGVYPSPKACASMVPYKDTLILFGGWSHPMPYPLHQADHFFSQLHIYSPSANRWSHIVMATSPPGKAGHSASIVRDTMVVFGGSHGLGVSSNDVWVLNLREMSWCKKEIPDCSPLPRYGHSQVTLDDEHLLVIGGCGGPNMQFNDVWLLTMGDCDWSWQELQVQETQNAATLLWCHPACKVGDTVVVLSKLQQASPRTSPGAVCKPPVIPGHSRQDRAPPPKRVSRAKKVLQPSPDRTKSVNMDPVTAASTSRVDRPSDCNKSGHLENKSADAGVEATRPDSLDVKNRQPVPIRDGLPSVRPNAMKNRQKQLETLQKYEEKFCNKDQKGARAKNKSASQTLANSVNFMCAHSLDISQVLTCQTVSWLPPDSTEQCTAPDETIFYSIVVGRGELIMFGGIQADLHSMQREMTVSSQVVNNQIHFLRAERDLR